MQDEYAKTINRALRRLFSMDLFAASSAAEKRLCPVILSPFAVILIPRGGRRIFVISLA